MQELTIEEYIDGELSSEEQYVAKDFICYLKEKKFVFYKDNCAYWRDKIYYWVKSGDECICFISIKNPEEKENHWTVWSADMGSGWLEDDFVDDEVKEHAWKYVEHCGHCGSCGGGRRKVIFGKVFDDVCGCTFRIDNPKEEDLKLFKTMVEIRLKEISSKGIINGICEEKE